jgi:hypothetical protein
MRIVVYRIAPATLVEQRDLSPPRS